jgi:hypothetical protein
MALIDEIERLGALAEDGAVTAEDAAHQLFQVSGGGLTKQAARGLIEGWRTARAEYGAGMAEALRVLLGNLAGPAELP